MTQRRWFNIGVVKIPHAERDVAKAVLGRDPYRFADIIGADTADDDPHYPVGSRCTYSALLTDDEAEQFRNASNCRYVSANVDVTGVLAAPDAIPGWRTKNWLGDWPEAATLTGTTVPVAILDCGTSAAVRTYKNITYLGRIVTAPGNQPPTDGIYTGIDHGCLAMGTAIPNGGRLLDAVIINDQNTTNDSAIATAITWAVNQGAKVVNGSFTMGGTALPATLDALTNAASADVIFYFALGNDAANSYPYPAWYGPANNLPYVYAVGAYDISRDQISSFSNWHAAATGVAPGEMVRSITDPSILATYEIEWMGTSAACPHTAYLAARLISGGVTARAAGAALAATTIDMGQAPYQCGGRFSFRRAAERLGIAPPVAAPVDPVVFSAAEWPGYL